MTQPLIALSNATKSAVPLSLVYDDEDPSFAVEQATATAGLSEGFRVVLRVKHARGDLNPAALVGRRVKVFLDAEPERPAFSGMASSVRLLAPDDLGAHYEVVVCPRTEWMSLRRDHRIFKNKRAPELAVEIARPLAARVGEIVAVEDTSLPVHEYRVQYGESDLAAMTRLLADDGVSYAFDFSKDSVVVLIPDTTAYALAERTLPFVAGGKLQVSGEAVVTRVGLRAHEHVRQVSTKDAWMERPDFEASSVARLEPGEDGLEHYAFEPGIENAQAELTRQAMLRLFEHDSPSNVLEVTTNSFVAPGSTLFISQAPIREAEVKLLVIAVTSRWSGEIGSASASHTLVCIPQTKRWVPPRPPKPVVAGLQKALVVGEGEIDADEHGRVLCRFDWDRGKLVTRRVEVSQAWAGPGYGLFTQPRVGDQVLVAYLDGDPDEPVIVGRVHNGKNLHPIALPVDKAVSVWRTKSTPGGEGFNEILLDDNAGRERFAIHAQLDYCGLVERDAAWQVKRNFHVLVDGDQQSTIRGRNDTQVTGDSTFQGPTFTSTTHELFMSSTTMTFTAEERNDRIYGTYQVDAGTERHSVRDVWSMNGPVFQVDAEAEARITVGGASITVTSGCISLKVGGSSIELYEGNIFINSPLVDINP